MEHFFETLRKQRWDDHRYYHHSRINQSLAPGKRAQFPVCAYVLLFSSIRHSRLPWSAGSLAMVSRQVRPFFLRTARVTDDQVNNATHEHKEEIKVGYNLQRKIVLLTIWALSPLVLFARSDTVRAVRSRPCRCRRSSCDHVAAQIWLAESVSGGLLFRTDAPVILHRRTSQTGLVWLCKILTDPFHDM